MGEGSGDISPPAMNPPVCGTGIESVGVGVISAGDWEEESGLLRSICGGWSGLLLVII